MSRPGARAVLESSRSHRSLARRRRGRCQGRWRVCCRAGPAGSVDHELPRRVSAMTSARLPRSDRPSVRASSGATESSMMHCVSEQGIWKGFLTRFQGELTPNSRSVASVAKGPNMRSRELHHPTIFRCVVPCTILLKHPTNAPPARGISTSSVICAAPAGRRARRPGGWPWAACRAGRAARRSRSAGGSRRAPRCGGAAPRRRRAPRARAA